MSGVQVFLWAVLVRCLVGVGARVAKLLYVDHPIASKTEAWMEWVDIAFLAAVAGWAGCLL